MQNWAHACCCIHNWHYCLLALIKCVHMHALFACTACCTQLVPFLHFVIVWYVFHRCNMRGWTPTAAQFGVPSSAKIWTVDWAPPAILSADAKRTKMCCAISCWTAEEKNMVVIKMAKNYVENSNFSELNPNFDSIPLIELIWMV